MILQHYLIEIIHLKYHLVNKNNNYYYINNNSSIELIKQLIYLFQKNSFLFSDLKQSAQQLLHDLDKRSTEDKVKRFLNNLILDQQYSGISTR
jgi:hypothetical protein